MTAPHTSGTAQQRRRRPTATAWLALALAVVGAARTGAQADPQEAAPEARAGLVEQLIVRTEDADARVRGEAALALATVAGLRATDAIRAVAADRHADARLRGLIALGTLGAAGVEVTLGAAFDDAGVADPDRHAAAFGLGLLPTDHLAPAIDDYLGRLAGASAARERDTLVSLLANWTTRPQPLRAAALHALLDDASIRDGTVRALAFRALAQLGDRVDRDTATGLLAAESAAERLAALAWFDAKLPGLDGDIAEAALRIAARDDDVTVRAAACELLLHARHPASLTAAAALLEVDEPVAIAVAVRGLLELGGGQWRDRLALRIAQLRAPAGRVAALGAWKGTVPAPLASTLAAWLTARRRSPEEKLAAAALLAREAAVEPALAHLRGIVADGRDPDALDTALEALAIGDPDLGCLDGLETWRASEAAQLPARVAALAVRRPEAAEVLLAAALADPRVDPGVLAAALTEFRRARMPALAPATLATLPARLAEIVAGRGAR